MCTELVDRVAQGVAEAEELLLGREMKRTGRARESVEWGKLELGEKMRLQGSLSSDLERIGHECVVE